MMMSFDVFYGHSHLYKMSPVINSVCISLSRKFHDLIGLCWNIKKRVVLDSNLGIHKFK